MNEDLTGYCFNGVVDHIHNRRLSIFQQHFPILVGLLQHLIIGIKAVLPVLVIVGTNHTFIPIEHIT